MLLITLGNVHKIFEKINNTPIRDKNKNLTKSKSLEFKIPTKSTF